MVPSSRTPLGRKVSDYLRQAHPTGLTVSEIYDRLVADIHFGGVKQGIVDLLAGNPQAYAKGTGGRWLDALLVAEDGALQETGAEKAPPVAAAPEQSAQDRPAQRPGRLQGDYVVFDLETLISDSAEGRRIIEISGLKFLNGSEAEKFQRSINPQRPIDPATEALTHISDGMVAEAPTLEQVLPEFVDFIGQLPLVAHNGRGFDLPTLNYWCRFHGIPEITNNLIDTLDLCLVLFPTEPTLTQRRVNELLHRAPFHAHRAEADVAALADIFQHILARLAEQPREVRQAINEFYAPFVLCGDEDKPRPGEEPAGPPAPPVPGIDAAQYASVEGVRSIFAPGGRRAEQFGPGYEDRPSQTAMAELVWQAFSEDRYWLMEAPTGTGKTDAYLYPSIVWALTTGQKVFISAHTKQLQDQIRKAIEGAQGVGFPARYAVLKGRGNYVCWVRWRRLVDGTSDPLLRAFLLSWRHQTQMGTLDEFPAVLRHRLVGGAEGNSDLQAKLCAEDEICDHDDPLHAGCPYHEAIRQAWAAHLVVVNHALLLTAQWGTQRRPAIEYLVCDEAHNLEDAATLAVQAQVSDRALARLADLLEGDAVASFRHGTYRATTDALRHCANQLRFHLRAFGDGLVEFVRQQTYEGAPDERYPVRYRLQWGDVVRDAKRRWAPVKSAYAQVRQQLVTAGEQLTAMIDRASLDARADRTALGELRAASRQLHDTLELMEDILCVGNANNVYWVEVPARADESPRFRWALHRAPIKIDWFLREKLYESVRSIVFTSATLTVNHGFDFYLDRFGLDRPRVRDRVHARMLPSVFQTKDDILFAIPQNVGRYHPRRASEFIERAGQEIHQLLHLQRNRSLLLFNARERMVKIYERTARPLMVLGLEPYTQGTNPRGDIEELRRNASRVQFGLKTMWEGVDAPGMSYVMIEKLPFPLFFDPVIAARMERARKDTGSDFYGYTLPHMVIQFKQGFGRLYRRNGDHGVVVLLDRALRRASYRDVVLRSLPAHRLTLESEEPLYRQIKAFFGGELSDADLLRQRTPFQQMLDEHTLPQQILTPGEYDAARPGLLAGLQALFDFPSFIGKQEEIIRAVLSGGDTLGVLPTGGGKSLTFQLPAVLRDGLTLVVSPLIALMKDQVDKLRDEKRIGCVDYIVSGQSSAEQDEILQRMVDGELRLVYVSPERFRDRRLQEALGHCRVIQFVVDEAHCVSMWGHDFRPDFLYVHDTTTRVGRPPLVALTATATPPVRADIKQQLHMQVAPSHEIVDSFDRPNLRFIVKRCSNESEKERWLMRLLYRSVEPAIVYVATRRDAELIASMLRDRGIAARAYHAGMERYDRDVVQEMFMNDQIRVVVATNAFGMGVDKDNIRYVIHYHFPGGIESFYQEAGRAGRKDQVVAYSIVLYTPRDRRIQEYFIKQSIPSPQVLAALFDFLRRQPGQTLYLSDEDLAGALAFEEQALRIGLHILEQEGYIRRGYDFAAGAAIKIFEPLDDVLARVEPAERRATLAAVLHALAIADYGEKRGVNLARLCDKAGLELEATELLLIELNRAEVLSYRVWEKGYTIFKQPRLLEAQRLDLDQPGLLRQVANARRRLQQMVADYLETHECRRVAILRYFGEQPPYEQCHKCDICGLPEEVPWAQTFDVDLPDLYTVYHPGYVAIEAASHFHGQYGRTKVMQALIGQSFNPWDRKALPRALTDSDYFQALRGYRLDDVRQFFQVLERQGYIGTVAKEIGGRPLPMIAVTEKGLRALGQGDTRSLPTIGDGS